MNNDHEEDHEEDPARPYPWGTIEVAARSIESVLWRLDEVLAETIIPTPDYLWNISADLFQVEADLRGLFSVPDDGMPRPKTAITHYLARHLATPAKTIFSAYRTICGNGGSKMDGERIAQFLELHRPNLMATIDELRYVAMSGFHAVATDAPGSPDGDGGNTPQDEQGTPGETITEKELRKQLAAVMGESGKTYKNVDRAARAAIDYAKQKGHIEQTGPSSGIYWKKDAALWMDRKSNKVSEDAEKDLFGL